ncbi:MAG: hypothetical protein RR620_05395 [Clostridium sp.]
MKLCTNCIHYESSSNYCNHFKFKANSTTSASICCKYTEVSNKTQADGLLAKEVKPKKIAKNTKSKETTKCIQCSKLFFNSYCSALNKNIMNPNKPIKCTTFEIK